MIATLGLLTLLLINPRVHLRVGHFEDSLTREDWHTLDRIDKLYRNG
jgi:hypothetical protein